MQLLKYPSVRTNLERKEILWTPASFFIRPQLMQSIATLYSWYKHLHVRRLPSDLQWEQQLSKLHFSDDQVCSQINIPVSLEDLTLTLTLEALE